MRAGVYIGSRRAIMKAGRCAMETFFLVLAVTGILVQLLIVVLALFEPGLQYRIPEPPSVPAARED